MDNIDIRTEQRTVPSTGEEFELLIGVWDGIELHASPRDRRVHWCSDWARVWDIPAELLKREHGGPATYGHTDFILPAA